MKRTTMFCSLALAALVTGCNGGGNGQGGDAFMSELRQMTATAPEDGAARDVDGFTATAPEDAEPEAI